jgi:hypothetical protein
MHMTQYFHVDESGDPGIHSLKGVPYFVLAMVQLPDREPIANFADLRSDLHVSQTFEFHYHQMSPAQKNRFFGALTSLPFRVRAAVLVKADAPSIYREMKGTEVIIDLITKLTFRASPLDIGNDVLILDGVAELVRKALRIHLSNESKRLARVRPFKKIVSENSAHNDGLQLADMVAGAIRDRVWKQNSTNYQTFANRVVDLWQVK